MATFRKIFLFIIILAALVGGYLYFSKGNANKTASGTLGSTTGAANVGTNATSSAQAQIGSQFLATLLNLKNITLDDSIFTQPSFTSLQDDTAPIGATDPEGRTNPFAPLGLDLGAAAALSSGTSNFIPTGSSTPDTTTGNAASVVTLPADTITSTTATLNGSFAQVASGTRSFEWGTKAELGSGLGTKTADAASTGVTWNKKLTGLLPATTYSYRAVAKVGVLVFNGPTISFTTLP